MYLGNRYTKVEGVMVFANEVDHEDVQWHRLLTEIHPDHSSYWVYNVDDVVNHSPRGWWDLDDREPNYHSDFSHTELVGISL